MLYNLFENRDFVSVFAVALLAEGVDRNKADTIYGTTEVEVALLAEGVDRNFSVLTRSPCRVVALLAEGVDRNSFSSLMLSALCVALLAEGVDRNVSPPSKVPIRDKSPSSRRAWIEIGENCGPG